MAGAKTEDGKTRQQEVWDGLRELGRAVSTNELAEHIKQHRKVTGQTLCDLREKGYVRSHGKPKGRMTWESVGTERPNDGRAFRPKKRYLSDLGYVEGDYMVHLRREGTPGEIPRIPMLAEALQW